MSDPIVPPEPPPAFIRAFTRYEDRVVGLVALGGITLGLLSFLLPTPFPPIVVAILFSLSVATLLYRFLGGIDAQSFVKTEWFRLAGSGAVLFLFAWFVDGKLERQMMSLEQLFTPKVGEWFPVERSSFSPVKVKLLKPREQELPELLASELAMTDLGLSRSGGHFDVVVENRKTIVGRLDLGKIPADAFKIDWDSANRQFGISGRLQAGESFEWSSGITLTTGSYTNDSASFQLKNEDGGVLKIGRLSAREVEFVQIGADVVLIIGVEMNHQVQGNEQPWSRFALLRLRPKITPT